MARTFDDKPAVREATPLFIGLIGPSGGGKTFSALRLATGVQRVVGGEIFFIDTESRRALHYADRFTFRHVPFGAPFSPGDYLEAIEHCVKKGAKTLIVDSMSHEHEGPGGVLDMHEVELQRLSKGDEKKAERVKMLAWVKPKLQRQRLINTLLQMDVNPIFCFRAKEKLKLKKGEDPEVLGWMPIAGYEYVFEMTLKCLLLPGANGEPTWQSENRGERQMIKLPEQFRTMFGKEGVQLTEDVGETLARWAAGSAIDGRVDPGDVTCRDLLRQYEACSDAATYRALGRTCRDIWESASKDTRAKLRAAADRTKTRIEQATTPALESDPPPGRQSGDD
jgi:hypothetical protein